ncbi:MAG: DegV family protein [Acidimicrobiales bacterium]|nr:DegV family protein [Acidimicrobiales bacterium]
MIGLCCDSGAQLPPDLVARHGIEVVPLTVTVAGRDWQEGVDLDADSFWAHFDHGRTPEVATAAPAPGAFADAYARLAERGAEQIISVHTGSEISGTFNAARLGAEAAAVPVELVDTGVASFAVGLAALAAAEALLAGAGANQAAAVARAAASSSGNVFVVGALDLPLEGGRLAPGVDVAAAAEGIPVLQVVGGTMDVIGQATDVDDAAAQMADAVLAAGHRLRVGIARADRDSWPLADAFRQRLERLDATLELLEYRVGPSVGAHTGPGTTGAVYHPVPDVNASDV